MMTSLTATVVLAAAIATAAASGATATAAAGCGTGNGPTKYSSTETIKGKQVIVNCGPASAKLHYHGTTYTFKPGTCFRYLGSFKLNLGRSLLTPVKVKNGYTNSVSGYGNMTITAAPNGSAEIAAADGKITIYVAAKWSGAAVKGTFTSITNGVAATGSWNCGAAIRNS
jgi:hypothetical protein